MRFDRVRRPAPCQTVRPATGCRSTCCPHERSSRDCDPTRQGRLSSSPTYQQRIPSFDPDKRAELGTSSGCGTGARAVCTPASGVVGMGAPSRGRSTRRGAARGMAGGVRGRGRGSAEGRPTGCAGWVRGRGAMAWPWVAWGYSRERSSRAVCHAAPDALPADGAQGRAQMGPAHGSEPR